MFEIEISEQGVVENLLAGFIAIIIQKIIIIIWRLVVAHKIKIKDANLTGLWICKYNPRENKSKEAFDVIHIRHSGKNIILKNWYYHNEFKEVYSYYGYGIINHGKVAAFFYGNGGYADESGCYVLRLASGRLEGGFMQFSLLQKDNYSLRTKSDVLYYGYKLSMIVRLRLFLNLAPFSSYKDAMLSSSNLLLKNSDTVAINNS